MRPSGKSVFVFLVLVALACTGFFVLNAKKKPNVVLILIDTTRADHLGVYGYERDTSPNLDKFAKESWWFKNAITTAPWTPPALASLFTGLYVSAHGMMPPDGRDLAMKTSKKLDLSLDTMAEIFQRNGYLTLGVTPNPWITKDFNFTQGFERYQFKNRARAEGITRIGMEFADQIKSQKKPGFMFLHYLDPHDTYDPPEPYRNLFSGKPAGFDYDAEQTANINLYDGEIRYMDEHIGRLFDYLKEQGLYDLANIVVAADHGEQFLEHGQTGHGNDLHNEEVHVPLFIKASGASPREIDFTVSLADVLPTLLELCGIDAKKEIQGISLVNDDNSRSRSGVISEIFRISNQKAFISFEGKKIIVESELSAGPIQATPSSGRVVGVYDRESDRFEQAPLSDRPLQTVLLSDLDSAYQSIASNRIETDTDKISDSTLEQLKSLGYIQ